MIRELLISKHWEKLSPTNSSMTLNRYKKGLKRS